MSTPLSNPHDRFFKDLFSRQEAARDFLQHYLPTDIVPLLDLDSLDIRKDSFIDPDLQEHFSDLLSWSISERYYDTSPEERIKSTKRR